MEEAIEVQIAEALVKELNDPVRNWNMTFVSFYVFNPVVKLEELGENVIVQVVVTSLDQTPLAKARVTGNDRYTYGGTILIQQKIVAANVEETREACKPLSKLCDQILLFMRDRHALSTLTAWRIIEAQRPELFDMERLHIENVFESGINFAIEGDR